MKIAICGSMTFANEMVGAKKKLEKLGHLGTIPEDTEHHLNNSQLTDNLEEDFKHCLETDVMRKHMKAVADSEAILVLNFSKNGLNGYIGTSTLIEMGLAYFLGKKIFLLYEPPEMNEARWAIEVRIMQPIVLDGDLSLVY